MEWLTGFQRGPEGQRPKCENSVARASSVRTSGQAPPSTSLKPASSTLPHGSPPASCHHSPESVNLLPGYLQLQGLGLQFLPPCSPGAAESTRKHLTSKNQATGPCPSYKEGSESNSMATSASCKKQVQLPTLTGCHCGCIPQHSRCFKNTPLAGLQ